MDIKALRQDSNLADAGVWVEFEDCKFKIRSTDSPTYRRILGKLAKKKNANRLKHDPEAMHEITVEGLADGILVDWSGKVEDNGVPLDFKNRQHRLAVCGVETIRTFLATEAQDLANFQQEATASEAEDFPTGD
jgi:hypothetical protein